MTTRVRVVTPELLDAAMANIINDPSSQSNTAVGVVGANTATVNVTGVTTAQANSLVQRDAAGRTQFVDPAVPADAATKNYVDTNISALGATTATANTLAKRDGVGDLSAVALHASAAVTAASAVISGTVSAGATTVTSLNASTATTTGAVTVGSTLTVASRATLNGSGLTIASTGDVNWSANANSSVPLQIGLDNGNQVIMDNNEFASRVWTNGTWALSSYGMTVTTLTVTGELRSTVQGSLSTSVVGRGYADTRVVAISGTSTAQSIASGGAAPVLLTFNHVDKANTSLCTTATGKITCVTPGWYMVFGQASFNNTAQAGLGTMRYCQVWLNGSASGGLPSSFLPPVDSDVHSYVLNASGMVFLNAGDYLQLYVQQDSGSTLTLDQTLSFLQVCYVSP